MAAAKNQDALGAVEGSCRKNYVKIAADKTEAPLVTTDPKEVNAKSQPALTLAGSDARYKPTPWILGVKFDSQLNFAAQASAVVEKLRKRTGVLRVVVARGWGANTDIFRRNLHRVCPSSGPSCGWSVVAFTSDTTRARMEAANNAAARVITGVGAGSRAATTCMDDADILPVEVVACKEAAKMNLNFRRMGADHHLRRLSEPPAQRKRIQARGRLFPCWRETALESGDPAGC